MAGSKLKKIGSLWAKRSDRAGDYLSGLVGSDVKVKAKAKIYIFANSKPAGDNSPDYFLMVDEDGLEQGGGSGSDFT